jgi:hypothetical protein
MSSYPKSKKDMSYYSGEGGVFYSVPQDFIFILKPRAEKIAKVINRKVKIIGRYYNYESPKQKYNKIAVLGMCDAIKLGEL